MIKRIELQGFKSFAKTVSIPLSNGFTAIVGPNGSGKSNLQEAICFVLGSSKASSLRAERLTHLIYNGGKGRAPAQFMEATLVFDNSKRQLPFESEEVKITRRLTRNGTMSFKINEERATKAQVMDALSSSMLNPDGHNIVMQGDITSFIEMSPMQRRQVIDDISGIADYNDKRDRAQKDLDVVESRIKELVIVMAERKKHINTLKREKEDAETYDALKKELVTLEGNLAFTRFSAVKRDLDAIQEKIDAADDTFDAATEEYENAKKALEERDSTLKTMDRELIQEGGGLQLALKNEVGRLKSQLEIGQSKIESKQAEIARLDEMITKLGEMAGEESGKSNLVNMLKREVDGVHGRALDLLQYESRYATAIDAALGGRKNYIIVDTETTALACVDYLKQNRMGRATFLPLNKIQGREMKDMKSQTVFGLAARIAKYDAKYSEIFSYLFGNTYVVDALRSNRGLIGKFRMVSMDGDVAEKSGAITGGQVKKRKAPQESAEGYTKERDRLLDEIGEIRLSLEEYEKKLTETEEKAEKSGVDLQNLQKDRGTLEEDIENLRTRVQKFSERKDSVQREISDLRVDRARVEAKMTDIEIAIKKFDATKLEEGDLVQMEKRAIEVSRHIQQLEPVNMKAIELYEAEYGDYKVFEEKFMKLQKERNSVLEFIEEIEDKKKEVFYKVFNIVAEEFATIFPRLSPNGEAKIVMENTEDPLNGGMLVEARPAGKKVLSIDSMSGGEKVLTALSFLFALQRIQPAPFYVLDEVDAALDQNNSMRFVELLNDTVKDAQLLVVSHNSSVIKKADRLFGVSMQRDGTSKIVGIELSDEKTINQYADNPENDGTKIAF